MEIKLKIANSCGIKESLTLGNPENISYIEMIRFRQQVKELIYSAPIEYAFGTKQEDELLAKWGLKRTDEDLDKIVDVGYGGYALKTDITKIKEIYAKARQMEIEFNDNNHTAFAEWVLYEFHNYPSKAEALQTIRFTPNEENKKIVKEIWKKWCSKNHIAYRYKWIDTAFSNLLAGSRN